MTYWNYRITKTLETCAVRPAREDEARFAIREVHYDANDQPTSWSDPVGPFVAGIEDGPEEVRTDLELMLRAFDLPVLDLDAMKKPAP